VKRQQYSTAQEGGSAIGGGGFLRLRDTENALVHELPCYCGVVSYGETQGFIMRAEITRKLFTTDEYYRMAEVGILTPDERVELIEGEIIRMSPIGLRHAARVNRATDLFTLKFRGKATVTVQNPVHLNQYNAPQPDILLLKHREDYYASKRPSPEDTLLLLEVSDTTLGFDLNVKTPIYAATGVPEVWIADLRKNVIRVFRNPEAGQYRTVLTFSGDDALSVLAFPDVVFKASDLIG
jgi:Uma2 family endonuclease